MCAKYAAAQDSYRSQVVKILNASTVEAAPETGCTRLQNAEQIAGNVAVIKRGGGCTFVEKARNAQAAGAVAVIITDNQQIEPPIAMPGDFSAVSIPAMMVTQDGGAELRENSGRACTIQIGMRSLV
jgi:hypothetical protein